MTIKAGIGIVASATLLALFASTAVVAGSASGPRRSAQGVTGGGNTPSVGCTPTAASVLKACRNDAGGSYWLAVGKCQNMPDRETRDVCRGEARETYGDDLDECREQHEARLDVCEALGEAPYAPPIDPGNFAAVIDNPFLPLAPGTAWIYEGRTEEGMERIVVEVTGDRREILGVPCAVVRDQVFLDGELIEDTFDWYAQDLAGSVWYFGERSFEIEGGMIVSLEGSWEAGVNGAQPGIVMPADPDVGDVDRQEFLLGAAEDMAEVVDLHASVTVPHGTFGGCLKNREWTPISPDAVEFKYYAPGVGLVLELNPETGERVELVELVEP